MSFRESVRSARSLGNVRASSDEESAPPKAEVQGDCRSPEARTLYLAYSIRVDWAATNSTPGAENTIRVPRATASAPLESYRPANHDVENSPYACQNKGEPIVLKEPL